MDQLIVKLQDSMSLSIMELENGEHWLMDSGANIPIWYAAERQFKKRFPGAVLTRRNVSIGAVNGKIWGNEYLVQDFIFLKLHYKNIHVIVSSDPSKGFEFALCNSMFLDIPYLIDNEECTITFFLRDGIQLKNRSNIIRGYGKEASYHLNGYSDNKLHDMDIDWG